MFGLCRGFDRKLGYTPATAAAPTAPPTNCRRVSVFIKKFLITGSHFSKNFTRVTEEIVYSATL